MAAPTQDRRPRPYPPPQFPPHRPKLFARTPPAVFPAILGLLGLALALRQGVAVLGLSGALPGGLVEVVLGAVLALWLFAAVALIVKIGRRPAVLAEDMRVLPGRIGLAAATMGGMAAAAVLVPYAPGLALGLAVVGLVAHAGLAVLLGVTLARLPPEGRAVNPGLHLAFVGFILAAVPLAQLGYQGAARGLYWATMPVAALIWLMSLVQFFKTIPAAPLRPLLAIHLAPAALFSTVAALTGEPQLAGIFAAMGAVMLLVLMASASWLTVSGFSPMWAAFTFPVVAYANAVLSLGRLAETTGLVLLAASLVGVPVIAGRVLALWTGNRLAARTNAAEA